MEKYRAYTACLCRFGKLMCYIGLRKRWTRVRGRRPSTNTPACLVQRVNVSVDLGICRDIGSNYGTDGLYFGMECDNSVVWKAGLWLVENMLTRRWRQRICWVSNTVLSRPRPLTDGTHAGARTRAGAWARSRVRPDLTPPRSKVMQNSQFYTTLHRILITACALEVLKALFYANFRYLLTKALAQFQHISPTKVIQPDRQISVFFQWIGVAKFNDDVRILPETRKLGNSSRELRTRAPSILDLQCELLIISYYDVSNVMSCVQITVDLLCVMYVDELMYWVSVTSVEVCSFNGTGRVTLLNEFDVSYTGITLYNNFLYISDESRRLAFYMYIVSRPKTINDMIHIH